MVKLLGLCSLLAVAADARSLSVFSPQHPQAAERALRLEQIASQIKNEPRGLVVDNETFPLYYGPDQTPGSLAFEIQMKELGKLQNFGLPTSKKVSAFAAQWAKSLKTPEDVVTIYQDVLGESEVAAAASASASKFSSMQDFVSFYDLIAHDLEKPWSTDNSDVAFGAQRLVFKGFTMRLVGQDEQALALSLSDEQVSAHCGSNLTATTIRERKAQFVTDLSNIYQYNDPEQVSRKFVPNVLGFFCFNNDSQQLLPVEIRFPDTGLSYSPFDTADEWTLAKMALEAAEIDFQNMQHMAETHAMTIPMRVEAYRHLHEDHPIFQLFTQHVFADFALEMLSERLLLNVSTEVDKTFGFGATGALRFLYDRITKDDVYVNVANDLHADIARRGLDNIPTHKYVQYGKLYYGAFDTFVGRVLDTYYETDVDLASDSEVQGWAAGCAAVPHLRNFPASFPTKDSLRKLLTHVIFQSTFKHHAMNGVVSWHGVSMPYAVPAVWHPLPTAKLAPGEKLNLLQYTIPKELVADQVRSPAAFYRAIPLSETLLDAYRESAFADEPKLFPAIREYETTLRAIDRQLAETEAAAPQPWPYFLYRPSKLAYYTWI